MPGTDLRMVVPNFSAFVLRAPYAMPGTDLAYGATRSAKANSDPRRFQLRLLPNQMLSPAC
eukprot:1492242-Rhodomonas_salina.1